MISGRLTPGHSDGGPWHDRAMADSGRAAGEAAREVAVTAERCAAQLLSGPPASDPVDVAERLLAVQGQDQRDVFGDP